MKIKNSLNDFFLNWNVDLWLLYFVLVENSLSSFLFYVGLCSNYSFDSLFIDNSSRMWLYFGVSGIGRGLGLVWYRVWFFSYGFCWEYYFGMYWW